MSIRFKRSYRDRKQAVAKRKKVIIKVLILVFVFQILSTVAFSTIKMNSISMEPSLEKGSFLVYSPLTFGFKLGLLNSSLKEINPPARGNLIVFTPPYNKSTSGFFSLINPVIKFLSFGKLDLNRIGSDNWENQYLLKRIIAIPGDTLKVKNFTAFIKAGDSGYFLSEFEVIESDYDIAVGILPEGWDDSIPFSGNMTEFKLGKDQYFVMGDNRMQSSDSTNWGILDRGDIKGKVLLTYWPFRKFELFK